MLSPGQLELRRNTIGASDAAPILGISPHKSAMDVWQEKVEGKQQPMNPGMQRGNEIEDEARNLFNEMTGNHFAATGTLIHKDRPWQSATPDGINFKKDVTLEIKYNRRPIHELARKKQLPNYYMAQVQHQMCVFDNDMAYYFSYNGNEGLIVEVKRDQSFIDMMTEKEYAFWKLVMDRIPPDELEPNEYLDFLEMTDPEWELLVDRWNKACQAEAEKELIKEEMLKLTGGRPARGYGLTLSKSLRKGNVDYSKIPELQDVDLDRYRRKEITYWKVN